MKAKFVQIPSSHRMLCVLQELERPPYDSDLTTKDYDLFSHLKDTLKNIMRAGSRVQGGALAQRCHEIKYIEKIAG